MGAGRDDVSAPGHDSTGAPDHRPEFSAALDVQAKGGALSVLVGAAELAALRSQRP